MGDLGGFLKTADSECSSSCFRLAATQPASPLDQQARITRAARSITMLITDLVNSPVVPPLVDGCYLSSQKASVCRAAATTLLLLLLRAAALRPTSIFCYVPTYKAMEATSRSSLQPLPHSGSLRDPSGPVPLSSYPYPVEPGWDYAADHLCFRKLNK